MQIFISKIEEMLIISFYRWMCGYFAHLKKKVNFLETAYFYTKLTKYFYPPKKDEK